jgi:hypothetical protein
MKFAILVNLHILRRKVVAKLFHVIKNVKQEKMKNAHLVIQMKIYAQLAMMGIIYQVMRMTKKFALNAL